jgi:hypothetical protein
MGGIMKQVRIKCTIQPDIPTRNNRLYSKKALDYILSECVGKPVVTKVDLDKLETSSHKIVGLISGLDEKDSQYFFDVNLMESKAKELGLNINNLEALEIVPIFKAYPSAEEENVFYVTDDAICTSILFLIREKVNISEGELKKKNKSYVRYNTNIVCIKSN